MLLCLTGYVSSAQGDVKRCIYTTDGSATSQGLKVKFQYPCNAKEEKGKDAGVKMFSIDMEDFGIIETIFIKKSQQPLTTGNIEKMMRTEGLKSLGGEGTYLYGRRLKIDGIDCAEVATVIKRNMVITKLAVYTVRYIFPYKGNLVGVAFAVTGEQEADSKKAFNDYKALFLSIASATEFLN